MKLRLYYSRPGRRMSWSRAGMGLASAFLAWNATVHAQYVGQVQKDTKDAPELRAVAVLEWTGPAGKPQAARIVPVSLFDGEQLQDGGLYLARPEPMALAGQVEYQLKDNGKTVGLFDIKNAGQEQGSWVGYGDWKPVSNPKPAYAATAPKLDEDYNDDDKPVLHRKHPDADAGKSSDSSGPTAADADPDRPKLHKKDDSGDGSASPGSASSNAGGSGPVLHKSTNPSTEDADSGSAPSDPDRPVLKKPKPPETASSGAGSDGLATVSDPDRPRLVRGEYTASSIKVLPTLMGLPPDMQQAIAVSDAKNQPDHPWTYSWSNPDDRAKMKAAVEVIARTALGLNVPPVPAKTPRTVAARKAAAAAKAAPPPTLEDEHFQVFELAYGSGATMVLTAHTPGPLAQEKFVTVIAQPDLYGNALTLLKSVTDGAHLDITPRMRLVGAVDALADNRGELMFELRGDTFRQFALYRVLRGTAEKLFVSSSSVYGRVSE